MRVIFFLISFIFFSVISTQVFAQQDSAASTKVNNGKQILLDTMKAKKDSSTLALARKDSAIRRQHEPRKATLRSAIIPGWGQAYNHEYWKIPIVYGALAIPASLFVYNNNWYQRTKNAYDIIQNNGDTSKIYPKLKGVPIQNLEFYRNTFRKDRDYSVLFFLLAWAVNVADATVFAHLKDFDVGNDLSMQIKPNYNFSSKTPSLQFVFNFNNKQGKALPSAF